MVLRCPYSQAERQELLGQMLGAIEVESPNGTVARSSLDSTDDDVHAEIPGRATLRSVLRGERFRPGGRGDLRGAEREREVLGRAVRARCDDRRRKELPLTDWSLIVSFGLVAEITAFDGE